MLYSIAKNVPIVIALLKAHNISRLVLSPGGTNAAFIRGVQDDPSFQCYSVVDERSALYFAIGIYLSTGEPVAVCCTSAQATRNYIPGLTEAFYKHVPILAITFSKHPQYTYQEYMQAPDQTSLPKDAVRKTFSLPYISNVHDRIHCERLVNEAILELTHRVPAPIQLNVPMLDTELTMDEETPLPEVKVIRRFSKDDVSKINLYSKRFLIVVGENTGFDDTAIIKFAASSDTAIYVNHLSNMKNDYTIHGNLLLTCMSQKDFDEIFCPDILITIGGQTGDYPLFHKLVDSSREYEHWRISPEGDVVDTYNHLTKIFECTPNEFFSIAKCTNTLRDYRDTWLNAEKSYDNTIELPLSAAFVAQKLSKLIPENSYVNFSILNSLRIWNLFNFNNRVRCFCNVGAFGIDGCMSTFFGQSVMVEQLCYMFIGDLSFFYDMNSLGIRHIKNNVRIVLINNNGGVEFKLGSSSEKNLRIDKYIAAANHFRDSEGWAKTNGFDYYSIRSKETFLELIDKLIIPSQKPILFEIFTTDLNDSTAFSLIKKTNDKRSVSQKIVGMVKNKIKKML
jgi:2-succinyl-5-enolpyruvyl-6-hydroxy-3-cyclohexene-1-carboxylate synthase